MYYPKGDIGACETDRVRSKQLADAVQCGNTVGPVERQPQIADQMDTLMMRLKQQSEVISHLEARLVPVMSLAPQEPPRAIKEANEPTCPIAAMIQGCARGLDSHNEILRNLLIRLEV